MTLICPFNFIKGQMWKGKLKGHINFDHTIYEKQPLERSMTLIWPLNVIHGHKVNWKILYDFVHVLHTNIGHNMHL